MPFSNSIVRQFFLRESAQGICSRYVEDMVIGISKQVSLNYLADLPEPANECVSMHCSGWQMSIASHEFRNHDPNSFCSWNLSIPAFLHKPTHLLNFDRVCAMSYIKSLLCFSVFSLVLEKPDYRRAHFLRS